MSYNDENERTVMPTCNGEDIPVADMNDPEYHVPFENEEPIPNDYVKRLFIPRIAKFEKVSYEQFKKDMIKQLRSIFENNELAIQQIYENIKLPTRATKDSAGYDFYAPFSFKPTPNGGIIIPTGIRCKMAPGWVLQIYPRSGQGFKYGVHLYNSVGIIDSKK